MSHLSFVQLATFILFVLSFVVATTYVVTYHVLADWRAHTVGRVLMFKAVALAILLLTIVLAFLPGSPPWEVVGRLITSLVLLPALVWQYRTLWRKQRAARARPPVTAPDR